MEDTLIELTEDPLNVSAILDRCLSAECGAVSVFVGTTRDHHEGRCVRQLRYEAYVPMARSRLAELDREVRRRWPDVRKVALVHRVGTVAIAEASVVVAVASPHRRAALDAVAFAIDRIKADVPIWKKEEYDDGDAQWKANGECAWAVPRDPATLLPPPPTITKPVLRLK